MFFLPRVRPLALISLAALALASVALEFGAVLETLSWLAFGAGVLAACRDLWA